LRNPNETGACGSRFTLNGLRPNLWQLTVFGPSECLPPIAFAEERGLVARKKRGSFDAGLWLGRVGLVAFGLAAGYVWRSFAPMPLPGGGALAGDTPTVVDPQELAREAEAKRKALAQELDALRAKQQKTEEEMGEMQIREILGGDV